MRLIRAVFKKNSKRNARRPHSRLRRNTMRAGLVVAAAGLSVVGNWYLAETGWMQARANDLRNWAIEITGDAGLRVTDVIVSGRNRADSKEILAALDLERGSPILGVDIDEARARIESMGWVQSAEIARRLPDVIYVRVTEREPLALWQHNNRIVLIDLDGHTIQHSDLDSFASFPLVVGEGAPVVAGELIDLLRAYPAVAQATEAAIRVSDRRWNLRLHSGIDVRLPEEKLAVALDRLEEYQREHDLFDRDVVAVDLRVPDRLIVRVSPGANLAQPVKVKGKDT
ncbi:MAG: FtsQ-type POTRA domain-containing protein [Alphaproteobacteria bacterium]